MDSSADAIRSWAEELGAFEPQAWDRMPEIYRASRSAACHPQAVCGHFGNPALASR